MATINYQDFVRLSLDMLTTFGVPVSLLRESVGGVHNPTTGFVTGGADVTASPNGVRVKYRDEFLNGVLVLSGDQTYLLDPSFPPQMGDKLNSKGEWYSIVSIEPIDIIDVPILYRVLVRK